MALFVLWCFVLFLAYLLSMALTYHLRSLPVNWVDMSEAENLGPDEGVACASGFHFNAVARLRMFVRPGALMPVLKKRKQVELEQAVASEGPERVEADRSTIGRIEDDDIVETSPRKPGSHGVDMRA